MPHGNWSKEETLRIVKRHLDEHVSIKQLETEENINHSLVSAWVKRYREAGEDGLIAKKFSNAVTQYVTYFNCDRPAYALSYKSPVQFKTEQGF